MVFCQKCGTKADGKKKKSHIGGENKIFEIANAAVKNVREAIREKAD